MAFFSLLIIVYFVNKKTPRFFYGDFTDVDCFEYFLLL